MAPFPSEYASQMMHTAQILREKCPSSCDIFLECGGLRIAAHRIVVAAFSRVLAARVITLHPPVISLDYLKVSGDVVQRLVAYMYKPNNALRDYDNMQELYNCAQLLDVPTAVHDIEKYMSDNNQTLQMECLPKNQVQSLQLSNVESQILSEIFHLQNSDPHEHQQMDGIMHSSSNVNNNEIADNESDSNDTPAKPYTSIKPRSSARLSAKTVAKHETLTNYHSETLIVTSKSESILKTEQDHTAENMIVVQPDQPLEQPFEQPFEQPSDEVNMNSKSDPEQVFVEYRKEDGSYSCPHCNASFSYEDFLPHVQEYKVVERPYVCDKCSKTFKYAKHLKAHMRTHSNVRPYVCEICKAAFKDQKHLSRHSRLHSGEKPFGCSECSAAFAEKDRLARHIASCHDKRRPHACSHAGCTFRAAHLHGLKEHERTHIPPEERESSVCDVCGKELKGARSIRMHMLQHHGDDLTCIHCEYKSKYKNCLKSHMLRVHGVDLSGETTPKQHMCETCGFQSHFLSEYRRHVRRAHGTDPEAARPYACSFCAFRTASRSSLGMHERGHRGEAPFVCMQCPAGSGDGNGDGDGRGSRPAYTSQTALRRHERSAHSGPGLARPHRCPQCPAAYGELKNLTAHMYRHTGVKPFPCSLCPFATVKKARLVQHIRQAHGPEHVPAPQRNVHHAKHKTTNKTPANKVPGSKTKGSSQPFPPPLPPTTDPPSQLEMPSEIDQETAAAAVVMQSMASGEYLHQPQHLPPPQYQPLEHMDYLPQHQHQHQHQAIPVTDHQHQHIPVSDHQHQHIPSSDHQHQHQHIPVTDHQHPHQHISVSEQLPNMAELTNYAPVYSQPHIGAEQEVIATTVSSASLVVTLPHHHHLHLHSHHHQQQHHQQQNQQQQHHQQHEQHNPQQHHQQQQQQQQLPPTTDPNHMLSTPLSSSFHTYTPQTTDTGDRTLASQYRSEGILAGAAREAGLLAGGEIQEIQEENIQMPTQTSISGLDLSLQDSYSPSTSSNPSNTNLLPNSNVLQAIAINTNPNVSYSNLVITNSNPNVVPSNSHTSMVLSNANIVAANSNANVLSTSSISNAVPSNSNPNVVALRLYQP